MKDYINDNKKNIEDLIKINLITSDYLIEKNKYVNKINELNNLNIEFNKSIDTLNIYIKLYNEQYNKYNLYKKNATYIIILLIIIILTILLISIFPLFSNITYKIILLILLIILLIFTYINFKYKNISENFSTLPLSTLIIADGSALNISLTTATHKTNNIKFYNELLPFINDYSNTYNNLFNILRQNILTIGNKSFTQDSNIIIYKHYIEKKNKIINNKIKSTKLFNSIEIIKKQINYLNNIILIISLFSIILLISLIIYSFFQFLYIFIIVICIILISLLIIYFVFTIVQPTRMIADKKYWGSIIPSSKKL